jgi:CRP/FNR family cyclic AMP-dependent transcriptional regulator
MADAVSVTGDATLPLALHAHFERAGLHVDGVCTGLSKYAQQWRQTAALLEDLSPDEADTLGRLMPLVRARSGQALIREGDVGDWMLLLLGGTVDVFKTSEAGKVSRLAVIKEGAAVGEMSMLDSAPRYATCMAIEEVHAGVLTRAVIARLIEDHPAIGAKLLVKLTQLLAQRLRNTSNQLVKLLQKHGGRVQID